MTAKELAVLAAKALDSKKGEDIKIMEVTEQTTLADYFIIGYDILKKAAKGILNRQVFDENFLMAVATVGAMALAIYENGDYLTIDTGLADIEITFAIPQNASDYLQTLIA